MKRMYECGICECYHPWEFDGDCRDDANRFGDPEVYAEKLGINQDNIEVLSMQDRLDADCGKLRLFGQEEK